VVGPSSTLHGHMEGGLLQHQHQKRVRPLPSTAVMLPSLHSCRFPAADYCCRTLQCGQAHTAPFTTPGGSGRGSEPGCQVLMDGAAGPASLSCEGRCASAVVPTCSWAT
jgi:hypothetical protein